jgi:two-component system cell cycle sensor histidine kinase/response regulator CckA
MMEKQPAGPVPPPGEALQQTLPLQAGQAQVPYGRGEIILVVEDHLPVLEAIKSALEYLDYQILIASNGLAALEVYDRHQDKIDLVLTDVRMPEMDGLTLAQILYEQNPAIKTVLLTGYPLDLDPEAKDLLAQGIVVGWLQKPVKIEQLAHTVSRMLK